MAEDIFIQKIDENGDIIQGGLVKLSDIVAEVVSTLGGDVMRMIIRPGDTDLVSTSNDDTISNFSPNGTTIAGFVLTLPPGYDNTKDPVIRTYGRCTSPGTSENYRLQIEYQTGVDPYIQDGVADLTTVWSQLTPDVGDTTLLTDDKAIDRVTLDLQPNKKVMIKWSRLGGDAADDRAGTYRVIHWEIDIPLIKLR